uniref:Uncharacterized protein n=1 Tax=Anguilla anguilla TaxID=7936 RepID=A0A0E9RHX5_ANGAN
MCNNDLKIVILKWCCSGTLSGSCTKCDIHDLRGSLYKLYISKNLNSGWI